jgi:hypothetical protein
MLCLDDLGWRGWESSEYTCLQQIQQVEEGRADCNSYRVRTDPLDQTHISYYESGEVIPCDIVVLKDASGQVITVT